MKNLKIWLAIAFVSICKPVLAQELGKFRFTAGVGVSEGNKFSVYYFEPSRRIQKNIFLGARFELLNVPGVEELLSYSLAGHYYFPLTHVMNRPVRFFAGLGFGFCFD
ncbi:MAG: hypothetical protein ACKO1F_14685 [Flammeovirgaceae bacterium]